LPEARPVTHRLAGRTHHTTGITRSTTTTIASTTTKIARTTTTTHHITTTQTMESMTITAIARDMLCLTKMVWSTSTITTANAKDMYQTPMPDKKIKKRRNLLVEQPFMTHQEIADYFGTTRAAVSQLEISALRKLKKVLEDRGYTMEDFLGDDWDK